MKFKRLAAVLAAATMALTMVTAASAEEAFNVDSTTGIVSEDDNSAVTYETRKTLSQLLQEYSNGSYYTRNG